MKFSSNNNIVNLENVLSKVISSRRCCSKGFRSGSIWQPGRITNRRITNPNPWLVEFIRNSRAKSSMASPSITSIQSPISDISFNEMEQDDMSSFMNENIIDAQKKEMKDSNQSESLRENHMQEIFKMILTGNKDKIQDITTKDEYINALNEINPEKFIDCLKNLGEKIFDESGCTSKNNENNEAFDLYNSMNVNDKVANTYLATPIATPMDTPIGNSFLDEGLLSTSLSQNKMQNDMLSYVTNTQDSLNLMNYQFPSLTTNFDSSLSGEMPRQETFSPIQSNISKNQFIQPTPVEKLDDIDSTLLLNQIMQSSTPSEKLEDINLTSFLSNVYSDNSLIAQNELNTFSTPSQASSLSNMPSPIEELLNQELLNQISGTSPSIGMFNGTNSISLEKNGMFNVAATPSVNSIISPLQELPYPQIISPIIQNDTTSEPLSQMLPTPENTPLLINESATINDINNELFTNASSILGNNNINGSDENGGNRKLTTNEVIDCERVCSDLEKVNNLLLEVLNSLPIESESKTEGNLEENRFPTNEDIKCYKVKESDFDFTEKNVSKLASLSPIEFVQEDMEVQQMSRRGKGRPKKPKKLFRCPFESCQRKFNREYNLREHIRTHNPCRSKEYTCKICNESFYSSSVLNRHVASIHEGEKFCCKYCGRPFNRKDALRRHENTYCQKAKLEN